MPGRDHRRRTWHWWLRFASAGLPIGWWVMEQVPLPTVLALVAIGFIGGILFDRFVLWPLAALLARRLDGDDTR